MAPKKSSRKQIKKIPKVGKTIKKIKPAPKKVIPQRDTKARSKRVQEAIKAKSKIKKQPKRKVVKKVKVALKKAKAIVNKPVKVARKAKEPSGPKGYTPGEYAKFKEYKKDFNEKSIAALKSILQLNGTSRSGNKGELVEKCADGKVLGSIPRCDKCGGGWIKWNSKTGNYIYIYIYHTYVYHLLLQPYNK